MKEPTVSKRLSMATAVHFCLFYLCAQTSNWRAAAQTKDCVQKSPQLWTLCGRDG